MSADGDLRRVLPSLLPSAARRSFPFAVTITKCRMDPASVAISEGLDPTEPRTYAALSKRSTVPRTTLWNRTHGRPSIQEKAKSQQYLNPSEEKALVEYLLRMSNNGFSIPIKYLRSLALVIAHQGAGLESAR
jgi:hypothetical protein